MEGRSHALVDDHIALVIDLQAVIELRAARADLDVLQRVGGVGAGAPDATVLARFHVGHIGPHHRSALGAQGVGDLVHIGQLLRIGFVGGGELTHTGVGFLQVDVDDGRAFAKAKAAAGRVGLDVFKQLARGFVGVFHAIQRLKSQGWAWRYCTSKDLRAASCCKVTPISSSPSTKHFLRNASILKA